MGQEKHFFPEHDSWKRVIMVVGSLVAYNFLLVPLGFVLTTFCFVAFLVKCIFPQAWLRTVVTAVFSTAGAQIIFVNLLELQFPKDCLGSDGENCMEILNHLIEGATVAFQPIIFLLFYRSPHGNPCRCAPRTGTDGSDRTNAAVSFHIPPVQRLSCLRVSITVPCTAVRPPPFWSTCRVRQHQSLPVLMAIKWQSRARRSALGIAAIGSFVAGTIGIVGIMFLAPPMAQFALAFGPPEYFSMMLMGIVIIIYMSSGSILKDFMTAVFGLLLGTIGMDSIAGTQRLTFGVLELADGVGFIPAVMGLFGISEILMNVERVVATTLVTEKVKNLLPSLQDMKDSIRRFYGKRSRFSDRSSAGTCACYFNVLIVRHGEEALKNT